MKCIYPCSKKKTFPKCLICHILKTDIWEVFKRKLDNTIKIDRLQAPLVMLKWFLHNIYTIRKKTLPTKLITNPHANPRQPKETHFAKKPFSKNSWVTERHSWSSCRVINLETDDPKCHQSQCQSLFVISRHTHTFAEEENIFSEVEHCVQCQRLSTCWAVLAEGLRWEDSGCEGAGFGLLPTSCRQRKLKWSLVRVCVCVCCGGVCVVCVPGLQMPKDEEW